MLGVQSNLPLLAAVLDSSDFQAGVVSTEYLDTHLSGLLPSPDGAADLVIAAAGWEALRWESAPAAPHNPWRSGPLRLPQGDLEIVLTIDEERISVRARSLGGGRWLFTTPTSVRTAALSRADADQLRFEEPERTWSAAVVEHEGLIYTAIGLQTGRFERRRELNVDEVGAQGGGRASGSLQAPMPGAVASVSVEVGETVRAGQTVMILEAMKMEHSITAPHGGIVRKLRTPPATE
ncbi:MAG: biotin/lipoyl-containing protein [Chloroflexia bacterium]